MANFQPAGKVYIGNVPFDNSYRHTMTFPDRQSQTDFFLSCMNQYLNNGTYTYVRMNNAIRVGFNAEQLYTYDYVMYQNANYGDKWFYAFITAVNYINENTTELVLELDVMQTWYFDYTLVEGFVEREHVNDDTIGAHLNAEPGMDMEYIYSMFDAHTWNFNNCWIVLLVNAYPNWNVSQNAVNGSKPVSGGQYQGQYNACKVLLYKGWDASSLAVFKQDMDAFNGAGAAETICDAFTVPASAIDANHIETMSYVVDNVTVQRVGCWTMTDGSVPLSVGINHTRPLTLNGYTPRNNKLLCHPYTYLEVGDFTGRCEDYKWEFFDASASNNWTVTLSDRKAGISDCQGYVTPIGYNNIPRGQSDLTNSLYVKPFTYDFNNKISWVFSAYQTWAAQNAVTNQLAVIGSIGAMSMGAGAGIGSAVKAYGAGAAALNEIATTANVNGTYPDWARAANIANRMANAHTTSSIMQNANPAAIAGGAAGLAGTIATVEKMRRVPNTARGNTSGNSKLQCGYAGWYSAAVCIRREFAEIVDNFFDMFGYAVDTVKVPNRTGRPYWNYVKMQNSCHRGSVPASDMNAINQIYDAGITFWHTSDVGNYSLDNTL